MLDILGVKRNPQSTLYTGLGVITKGTIIEVNVSELGLVTQGGKVVWGKYAQVRSSFQIFYSKTAQSFLYTKDYRDLEYIHEVSWYLPSEEA